MGLLELRSSLSRLRRWLREANAHAARPRHGRCTTCQSALEEPNRAVGMIFTTSPELGAFHDAARNADLSKLGQWMDWSGDPDLLTAFVQRCTACEARYLTVWDDPSGLFRSRLLVYQVPMPATDAHEGR